MSTATADRIASPEDAPWIDPEASARAGRAAARRDSGRRRNIDPATCERDYTAAELEFLRAIQDYKRRSGRNFPTWGEVLEVIRDLGYRKDDRAA